MKLPCVLVFAALAVAAYAQDSTLDQGVKIVAKLYDDCKKADGFSPCLKKKAITFVDRLSRMEKLTVTDGITLLKDEGVQLDAPVSEDQLEQTLPRALEAKDEALTNIVLDKVTKFISSRSLDISVPRLIEEDAEEYEYDEARDGKIKIPKKKGGKGGKKKGMMGGMMMMLAGKLIALIPVAIAGLFLLAGKALITAKIALLLSGIIALKKLLSKKGGGGGHGGGHEVVHDVHLGGGGGGHGGWAAGGGGGGWSAGGSGGGWDKRSIQEAQNLAYSAYKQ